MEKATVIAYRNAKDVDVKFEDGTTVKHVPYSQVKAGKVKR